MNKKILNCSIVIFSSWTRTVYLYTRAVAIGPGRAAQETGKLNPPTFYFDFSTSTLPWHDNFTATSSLQGRMPKLVLRPPSLHLALQPSTAAGRSFTSSLRRSLAHPRHGILKEPWLPPPSTIPLPTTYFSPSRVRRELDGLESGPQNDHKPPDERVLKLGKSKDTALVLPILLRS